MENATLDAYVPCVTLHMGRNNADDLRLIGSSLSLAAVRAVIAELRREWQPEAANPVIAGRLATLDAISASLPAPTIGEAE